MSDPIPAPNGSPDPTHGDRSAGPGDPVPLDPYSLDQPHPGQQRLRLRRSGGRWYIVSPGGEA